MRFTAGLSQHSPCAERRLKAWISVGLGMAAMCLSDHRASSAPAGRQSLSPTVAAWLEAQPKITSWSAEFVQTRSLKTLTQPLKKNGRVWFAAPSSFRWELGVPAETIAVRATNELQLFYPGLKRVERFPLSGSQAGPWREALSLLEAGFPRSKEQMESQYNILDQSMDGSVCKLKLQPRSAAARKLMPQIKIEFETKDYSLRATELQFADGSSMRNDFTNALLNVPVDDKMFTPQIPPDFKVVEPLKKRK